MNTLDKNPWKVESIQEFSCLKCPECVFFTKEQNYFEDHAIANHPLSAILFDEIMSSYEIEDNFKSPDPPKPAEIPLLGSHHINMPNNQM